MKRQLIGLSILTIISISIIAGGPDIVAAPKPFNGFYVGAAAGAQSSDFKTNYDTQISFAGEPFIAEELLYKKHIGNNNFLGSVFAGYGWSWNTFYLGGQVSGNFGRSKSSINEIDGGTDKAFNIHSITTVRSNGAELSLDAQPGILFTENTLFHGTIGVAWNRFKLDSSNDVYVQFGEGFELLTSLNNNMSKSRAGFRIGAGLEQMINSNWSVGANYIHETFGSITSDRSATATSGFETFVMTNHTKVKLHNNSLLFNLTYHCHSL